jgi:hypothetical protein
MRLRFSQRTCGTEWLDACSGLELAEELRQAVGRYETAATPLGSFPALFQQALSLGLLSRRRVHAEASQALGSSPALLQRLAGARGCGRQPGILQRLLGACPRQASSDLQGGIQQPA